MTNFNWFLKLIYCSLISYNIIKVYGINVHPITTNVSMALLLFLCHLYFFLSLHYLIINLSLYYLVSCFISLHSTNDSACIISLHLIPFNFVYVAMNGISSSYLPAAFYYIMYIYHNFLIHSSLFGLLSFSHIFVAVQIFSMNTHMHKSFKIYFCV